MSQYVNIWTHFYTYGTFIIKYVLIEIILKQSNLPLDICQFFSGYSTVIVAGATEWI